MTTYIDTRRAVDAHERAEPLVCKLCDQRITQHGPSQQWRDLSVIGIPGKFHVHTSCFEDRLKEAQHANEAER